MPLYFVTFSQQLSKASCLIAEAFYSLGAGACKMAAEQPFLQNESSGLPPACKPKLQQAGVYYLVNIFFLQKSMSFTRHFASKHVALHFSS